MLVRRHLTPREQRRIEDYVRNMRMRHGYARLMEHGCSKEEAVDRVARVWCLSRSYTLSIISRKTLGA